VDWGTSFAAQHASLYGEQVEPILRTSLGRLARDFVVKNGGSCYLAETMIEEDLSANVLHRITDAPVIERPASALIPKESAKQKWLQEFLGYFPFLTQLDHSRHNHL
jgi:hypothetical protein